MSEDYSSFERDYFKKSKRRQDFKQPKISPKHIKVYEPKSAQKSLKTQGYADEPDHSPRYEDDYYDDYATYSKGDTYRTYISKTASSSKSKQGGNNRSSGWKKEIVKVTRGSEERQKAAGSPKENTEWVVSPKAKLFCEEKTAIVNNSNPKTLPAETKHSSGEDSSNISAGLSTTANTEDRRSSEMFDFGQDRPDPIQALKAMRRKESLGEEKTDKKQEEVDKGKESTKDESNVEGKEESEKISEDKELGDEDENNYSDIDGLMEKKILNNEIEINSDEDAFNDAQDGMKKKDVEGLDDEERPLWEDLDTNKMLEEIKKFDHLPMFSKDIKSSSKDNFLDGPQGNKEQKAVKDIWVKNRRSEAEEDDDDFEKFFSLKICDDADDVIPNIFHIWHKASSDKQAKRQAANESRLMKSQSFDSEIIKRKDSHTALPAFRNHRIQQESIKEEQITAQDFVIDSNKPKDVTISAQKIIFKALIPNYEAKVWYYKDLQGNVQGPFSGKMMDEWYSKGFLPLELDITITGTNGYRKLKELADVAAKTESQNIPNNSTSAYNNNAVQTNKSVSSGQYTFQIPEKVFWGHNQDNMNRDLGNMYNKGNGMLPGQFLNQNMVNKNQPQSMNLFSNMKPILQTKEYPMINQHESNENNKRSFQNVVAENQCPNMGNFNILGSNLGANNVMTSIKTIKSSPQVSNRAQIQLTYPVFNPQFENYKGMNGNQVINSSYRPQQMMGFNQLQGFDGSKVEANSNQLRNLPR